MAEEHYSPVELAHICAVLGCQPEDVAYVDDLQGGLTNQSTIFSVKGCEYVYRRPGEGTDAIVSRSNEARAQQIARELGLDGTFVYEDPVEGWKISRYLRDCVPFSCHDDEQMRRAMKMAHVMHESGAQLEGLFDIHEDTLKQIELLTPEFRGKYDDFDELFALACDFDRLVKEDGLPPVFCHNDFYDPNFLIYGDEMHLIDWEYAGMSDYASDLAVMICCSDFTYEEALHALELYFERPLTDDELFHNVAYICVVSFHWLVWALYRAQCGEPVGELEFMYHRYARSYGDRAREIRERLGR